MPSQPVSPPPSNPAPVSPPPSSPAPSGPSSPPVTNPQPTTGTGAGTGYIEVCKNATSDWVEGSFPFTITSGTTLIGTYSVAVGSCTGAIAVPAGTVTVTEAAEGQGYSLEEVLAAPSGNLGTVDLTAQTASFIVAPDLETTADFVNTTNLNWIKVCKTLSNNEGNLAGQTFDFNVGEDLHPGQRGGSHLRKRDGRCLGRGRSRDGVHDRRQLGVGDPRRIRRDRDRGTERP